MKPGETKILIVEDSPPQALQIKLLLDGKGYQTQTAANGQEGLQLAKEMLPDLVISDIVMPLMNGFEFCRELKRDKTLRAVPVILLTTLSDMEDIVKGLNAGADYYVTKPFEGPFLLSKVASLLSDGDMGYSVDDIQDMEFVFAGKRHRIISNYRRILNLLLSTYENAVIQNRKLRTSHEAVEGLNQRLKVKLDELQASEERFRSLVLTIPDIVYRIDADGNFAFINEAVRRLGYESAELIGRHFSEIILPADIEAVSRAKVLPKYKGQTTGQAKAPSLIDERRTGARKTTALEVRLFSKTRQIRPALLETIGDEFVAAEINSAGLYGISADQRINTFIGTAGVIRDISARKKAESALRESEQRLKTILNFAETGIVVIDCEDNRIIDANPSALRTIGAEKREVVGSKCNKFICPAEEGQCPVVDLGEHIHSSERTLIKADGSMIPILKTVAPIQLEGRKCLLESFVDISKLKEAEKKLKKAQNELEVQVEQRTAALKKSQAQLIQTEKVAALGTLTAGIAHELNNPMMGILNFVQYCLKHTPKDGKIFTVLQDAERESLRCAEIVRNLLTFSRIEAAEKEKFFKGNLRAVLNRVLRLVSYRIEKENIHLIQKVDKTTPAIWMKISNMQQVFLNIIGNALDALRGSEKKELQVEVRPTGNWVNIKIADSGIGIAPKDRSRIFDPFFTTKPVGKGTGLGLSISQGIIKDHGGKIACKSTAGQGTCFTISLPIEEPAK